MPQLISINTRDDIPAEYQDTPIGKLLRYHNLNETFEIEQQPSLISCMCIDSRKTLRIPYNFSFIIRTGGANVRNIEFKISYLVSMMGIGYLALITHTDCRMVSLMDTKQDFIQGMIHHAGWTAEQAELHFDEHAPHFQTGNELEFISNQQKRLSDLYPKLKVVPMSYDLGTNMLSLVQPFK